MGIFSKLKNIFFEEEKKTKQQEKAEQILSTEKPIPSPLPKELWICDACRGIIDCGERWSKQAGRYYHKQCYKEIKRGTGL